MLERRIVTSATQDGATLATCTIHILTRLGNQISTSSILLTGSSPILFSGSSPCQSHQYFRILYQDPHQSYSQDGAILAVCILTLVTAVILLIDFIIMARLKSHFQKPISIFNDKIACNSNNSFFPGQWGIDAGRRQVLSEYFSSPYYPAESAYIGNVTNICSAPKYLKNIQYFEIWRWNVL